MDTVANMLTTLINAQRVGKRRVAIPYASFTKELLEFLQQRGLVASVRVQEAPKAKLVVTLAYDDNNQPAIHGVRRLSKPGSRYYSRSTAIPYRYAKIGFILLSTSKGLKDDRQARREKVGGELICAIW